MSLKIGVKPDVVFHQGKLFIESGNVAQVEIGLFKGVMQSLQIRDCHLPNLQGFYNSLKKTELLAVHFLNVNMDNYQAYDTISFLKHVPKATHLSIINSSLDKEALRVIFNGLSETNIETLDLSDNYISESLLKKCQGCFAKLKNLFLFGENNYSNELLDEFKKQYPHMRIGMSDVTHKEAISLDEPAHKRVAVSFNKTETMVDKPHLFSQACVLAIDALSNAKKSLEEKIQILESFSGVEKSYLYDILIRTKFRFSNRVSYAGDYVDDNFSAASIAFYYHAHQHIKSFDSREIDLEESDTLEEIVQKFKPHCPLFVEYFHFDHTLRVENEKLVSNCTFGEKTATSLHLKIYQKGNKFRMLY